MSDRDSARGSGRLSAAPLVEHFFRHESGRLVSALSRVFGLHNLDLVEDMVQASLLEALHAWRAGGIPDNPSAWMHRVAKNKVIDALRHRDTAAKLAPELVRSRSISHDHAFDEVFLDSGIEDSQLRMIFACCHPRLEREDQIALTLKILCGFSNDEIARGLLVNVETIKKRVQRAKQRLVDDQVRLDVPPSGELPSRLNAVHQVLYLLFNEGYCASAGEEVIRADLCEEAARLCYLLCGHAHCSAPATRALMALMLFHAARLEARQDKDGRILLLEDQDRTKWDPRLINRAKQFLDQSATGTQISAYHLEAGIAMHHCLPSSFADTDWPAILKLYDMLLGIDRSPVYLLNRSIVIAHISGPEAGIRALEEIEGDPSLANYHLLDSTLGELHRRAGHFQLAREYFERARTKTKSARDRELLESRLALCVKR